VFLDEALKAPVETYAAAAVSGNAPASVTCSSGAASGGHFLSAHGGVYAYRVEAATAGAVSTTVASANVTIAAGDKNTLTITQSSDAKETYYNVYRSRKGGTNASADMRFIGRVAKTANSTTTTFVDDNDVIPGTSSALMLTSAPQYDALKLVQMAPPSKIPLAMTMLEYRFAVLYIACLRLSLPKKHAVIRNILPASATWAPFT
jgi:hypothetical protein